MHIEYAKEGLEPYEKSVFPVLIRKDDVVLDLGCGAGREARPVAGMCARVYAMDMVAGMIRSAKSFVDADNVYFLCADAMHLPLGSSTMDVVLMTKQFLNHVTVLEKRKAMLQEVYRVLKPGGRVFLTLHNNLFNMGIYHVMSGIYKLVYGRYNRTHGRSPLSSPAPALSRGNQTEHVNDRTLTGKKADINPVGGQNSARVVSNSVKRNVPGMALAALFLKIRSMVINGYRRAAKALNGRYSGKEPNDWEISQVSSALSPCKSTYHNFAIGEIEPLVTGAGFRMRYMKDTWELVHCRQVPGFLRKGAYTLAVVLEK